MLKTGDEYFDSKGFREILSEYEDAIAADRPMFMDADDLADIADYYQFVGKHDAAQQAADLGVAMHPGATLPLAFKAREALERRDVQAAKGFVKQIDDLTDPEYVYLTAEIMICESRINEANSLLKGYLDEQDEETREDVIIDAARLFADHEVFDVAREWLNLSTDTDHSDYKELNARVNFAYGYYADCIDIFRELVDRNPFSKRDWQGLASAQFMNGDFSDSVESIEYALALDPNDPCSIVTKANGMFSLENYEVAFDYYQRYCALVPDDESGEFQSALSLVCMERYEEAAMHFQKAQQIGKPDADEQTYGFAYMALCYNELHRNDEFMHYLTLACERNPQEAKDVLGSYFPNEMSPAQYPDFVKGIWGLLNTH